LKHSRQQRFSKAVLDALAIGGHDLKMQAALALSHEERLAFFEGTRVMHPKLKSVLAALKAQTRPFSGADVTLLLGPTGVGKTTIANSFYERTLDEYAQLMRDDLGAIPVIKLEAPATGEISFSHKIFYAKMLQELKMLHLKRKHSQEDLKRVALLEGHSRTTVGTFRLDVEAALEGRRCKVVLIDEAFHLVGGGGSKLAAQMNGLKSLSNETEVKFVLGGGYELLPILDINAALSRRCSVIHISRYHRDNEDDRAEFAKVLIKLGKLMPIENQPRLDGYYAILMRACVGLPGILKETLQRALNYALTEKGWTDSCLERALLTKKSSSAILADCLRGEKDLEGWISGSGSFEDYEDPDSREAA
jgi:hypothetical protein